MGQVSHCASRDELDAHFWEDRSDALPGQGNSRRVNPDGTIDVPDVIECYESRGCCIDMQFTSGKKSCVIGVPKLAAWRIVLDSAESDLRCTTYRMCVLSRFSFVINLIFLFWLRHHLLGIHKPVEGILVFVTVIYVAWFVVRRVFPLKVAAPGSLQWVAERLYGPTRYDRNWACFLYVADGRRPLWRPEGTLGSDGFIVLGHIGCGTKRVCRYVESEFVDQRDHTTIPQMVCSGGFAAICSQHDRAPLAACRVV